MLNVKFGACEWSLPGSGLGSAKMAKEIGLQGLQLGFITYEKGFLITQKWFRDYFMEEADKYGIALLSLAMCAFDYCGLKNKKTTEKGRKAYEMIEQAVEAADDMKMKMIMMPSFVDGFIDTDEDLLVTAEALKYACRLAAKYGITITTENLLTLERNKLLMKEVDEPNLKGFYDSQNYTANLGWDQVPMLEGLYDVLYPELHVKDGIGSEYSCRLLGEGDSDFYGTMRVLKERNYAGWLHLENAYDKPPLSLLSPENYIDIVKRDLEILQRACE